MCRSSHSLPSESSCTSKRAGPHRSWGHVRAPAHGKYSEAFSCSLGQGFRKMTVVQKKSSGEFWKMTVLQKKSSEKFYVPTSSSKNFLALQDKETKNDLLVTNFWKSSVPTRLNISNSENPPFLPSLENLSCYPGQGGRKMTDQWRWLGSC